MKKLTFLVLFVTIYILVIVTLNNKVKATPPNPPWCHCEPNGNCQTLFLPQEALEEAGHMDANGNPLHAGDHDGECVQPTSTPTEAVQPTVTPEDPTITPTDDPVSPTPTEGVCQDCTQPSPTQPEPDPTRTEPSPTSTPVVETRQDTTDHNKSGSWSDPLCLVQPPPAPVLSFLRESPEIVRMNWQPIDRADHYALTYGYYGLPLIYGIPYITGNANESHIGGLISHKPINVCVYVWRDNCVSFSCVDP